MTDDVTVAGLGAAVYTVLQGVNDIEMFIGEQIEEIDGATQLLVELSAGTGNDLLTNSVGELQQARQAAREAVRHLNSVAGKLQQYRRAL